MGISLLYSADVLLPITRGVFDKHQWCSVLNSRPLNTLYYTDLQLIISLFICIFLQVFVPLQYKTCRNIC